MNARYEDPSPPGNPLRLLLRIPVPWVFVLAYVVGALLERWIPLRLKPSWIPLIGGALFLAGAVMAGWSLSLFRKARTTTVPGEISSHLMTEGPYRLTRNPMYVGLTLAYLGEAGLLRQVWPVVCLPFVLAYLNWVVLPLEETRLGQAFGETYARYRSRVRRWI
jgi:protein-S-isoprenylcysteine O-methyltransferase Ste14